ncbi:MAG: N-acetyl-gamma-glutamyl-phosphate reductase [Spirochaetota bacterium]
MKRSITAAIIGATGYGGVGAIEILVRHPNVTITSLHAVADVGKRIDEVYPHLTGVCDKVIQPADAPIKADVVFFATPDGVGMKEARTYVKAGSRIIDYSGDFRFNTPALYAQYAARIGKETTHAAEDLLASSVYGLAELHRDEIKNAAIVGNPGCFAVSAILGAAPAVKSGIIDTKTMIFDAKSGVSGAGKKVNPIYHYPHRYEEMNAYKIGKHQHVMEVERELSAAAGSDITVTFTAQVFPVVRGIMTSVYARLNEGVTYEKALDVFKSFYANEPFVTVYGEKESVGNRSVRGSNRCAVWVNVDRRTNTLIILSHIDNLLKGQAGSAVQNMNIMMGLPETEGLTFIGSYP